MNARPSLRFDVMRATDIFGSRLTPPGFYYKTFIRPRRLWPLYEKVLRNAAGLGRLAAPPGRARVAHRVPAPPRRRARDRRRRRRHERRAARRRAGGRRGARRRRSRARRRRRSPATAPTARRELGAPRPRRRGRGAGAGRGARVLRRDRPGLVAEHAAPGPRRAPRRRHRLDRAAADVRGQRPARGDALLRRRSGSPRSTGSARARPPWSRRPPTAASSPPSRCTRPGSRSSRVADARRERRRRGARARGSSGRGSRSARQRRGPRRRAPAGERRGRRRARPGRPALADTEQRPQLRSDRRLRRHRPRDLAAAAGRRQGALGRGRRRLPPGRDAAGHPRGRRGRRPRVARARPSSRARSPEPRRRSRSSSATTADRARLEAEREALSDGAEPADRAGAGPGRERRAGAREVLRLPLRGRHHRRHQLLDRRGLRLARAAEALHDGDHGAVPGPDVPAGRDPADRRRHRRPPSPTSGMTTARPPWSTVPMGVLAGRPFEPAKRSAVHGRHRELGGNVLWAGDWRRPYDYGDPRAETMAVHEGAGPDRRLDARQADRRRARRPAPSSTSSTRTASTT